MSSVVLFATLRTPTLLDRTAGTNIGSMVDAGGLAAAFDGTTSQAQTASCNKTVSGGGFSNTVGKIYSSSKVYSKFVVYGPNDANILGGAGGTTVKFQGSTDGFTTSTVDLCASFSYPTGSSQVQTLTVTNLVPYTSWRFIGTGNGATGRFFVGCTRARCPDGMVLRG